MNLILSLILTGMIPVHADLSSCPTAKNVLLKIANNITGCPTNSSGPFGEQKSIDEFCLQSTVDSTLKAI